MFSTVQTYRRQYTVSTRSEHSLSSNNISLHTVTHTPTHRHRDSAEALSVFVNECLRLYAKSTVIWLARSFIVALAIICLCNGALFLSFSLHLIVSVHLAEWISISYFSGFSFSEKFQSDHCHSYTQNLLSSKAPNDI